LSLYPNSHLDLKPEEGLELNSGITSLIVEISLAAFIYLSVTKNTLLSSQLSQ
jgi:hypothetical protein